MKGWTRAGVKGKQRRHASQGRPRVPLRAAHWPRAISPGRPLTLSRTPARGERRRRGGYEPLGQSGRLCVRRVLPLPRVGSNRTCALLVLERFTTVRALRRPATLLPAGSARAAVALLWAVPGLPVCAQVPQSFSLQVHLLLQLHSLALRHGTGFPTSSLATGSTLAPVIWP